MKKRTIQFPPKKTVNAKAFFTSSVLLAQCIVGGVLFGLVITFIVNLATDLHLAVSLGVGAIFGREFYRIVREGSDDKRYDIITFNPDSMIVCFHGRPNIEIPYEDIVDVRYSYGKTSLIFAITANMPFMFLDLEILENGMDKLFVNYLKSKGVGN